MAEDNKALYYQQKECPICLNKITGTKIRSSYLRLKYRDTDLNLVYEGINPIHYAVWVCETCNYAALDSAFDQELPAADKAALSKGLFLLKGEEPRFAGVRTPEVALRSYELAIRTCQIRKSSKGAQAPLFLRAAWIARELGKTDLEMEYRKTARDYFAEAFEKERGIKLSPLTMMYLIGELSRRVGDYGEAVRWFSRAVADPKIKAEPEIERMARAQWELAREQQKNPSSRQGEEDSGAVGTVGDKSPQPAPPPPPEKPVAVPASTPFPPSRTRTRVKLMASLYTDQVEWLQSISNQIHKDSGKLVEKEAILRALLDGLMAAQIPIPSCQDEESLREGIHEWMSRNPSS